MRIQFVIWQRTGGGAERAVSLFASHMAKQGHEVYLVQVNFSEHDYPVAEQVNVVPFGERSKSKNPVLRKLARVVRYRALCRQIRADVVMPFLGHVVTENFFATRFLKTAFISTIRIDPATEPQKRLLRWGRNIINFLSDAVFVQNETQRGYYPAFMRKRIFVVPNPVSPEYLTDQPRPERPIVNCVASGRLAKQKNHSMIIDAVLAARESCPRLRLSIFGEGPLREQLQQKIDEAQAGEYIKLPGRTDDMLAQLEQADLYILSSDYEGMPNALMEAMAVGLPCISTNCPTGPSDLIEDGVNGYLIPVGGTNALTERIVAMTQNPKKALQMGERAKQLIRARYSPEHISAALADQCSRYLKGGKEHDS